MILQTKKEFMQIFLNWPNDSTSNRKDSIGSGSSWGIREIGTFQVLRNRLSEEVPLFLEDYWAESESRVSENRDFQALFELLTTDWRALSHEQIQKAAGPFAGFLSGLSQVLEEPITADTDRLLRSRVGVENQSSDVDPGPHSIPTSNNSNSQEAPNSFSSSNNSNLQEAPNSVPASNNSNSQEAPKSFSSSFSEPEYPNKRFREYSSPMSYVPSDPESDQSIYDQRAKHEFATNSCINELLRCVTELSRKEEDSSSLRMEWSIAPDTFVVQAGKHQFSSTNDGSLVHRATRSGQWQRVSDICYCSVEAKSWHNTLGKGENVMAQEAAHFVGMFSQRVSSQALSGQDVWLPLISVSQNRFSLAYSQFSKEYEDYLRDGTQSGDATFVSVNEYGGFRINNPADLKTVCTVIIALVLRSQHLASID